MLITTKGKTLERKANHALIEYSCGDHDESIYYIVNKKAENEAVDMFYAVPCRNHRFARRRFASYIREVTRA